MSRRLLSTALALAMAGGVYLTTGPDASASNMGFKLERSFSVVTGARNLYFVSFPLFNGLGDIGTSGAGANCDAGDGVVNAVDALCDLTTDRDLVTAPSGIMTIQRYNEATCGFEGASMTKTPLGFSFIGTAFELTTPTNREVGYIVSVGKNAADPTIENRAVIVGSHDPSWAGKLVTRACPRTYLNLPYHTMYRSANEILCGLRGVDWDPVDPGNPNSNPDACGAGLFDPVSGVSATVQAFDNATGFVGRTALRVGGNLQFIGTDFDLTPGDAYVFGANTGYQDRLWLPPHF